MSPRELSSKNCRISRVSLYHRYRLTVIPIFYACLHVDVLASERQDLFIKKLNQCCVLFDFNDSMADLKGKEIKRQTLTELVEYITSNRGVITEAVYPDIIKMVAISLSTTPMATHVFS